MRGAKLASLAPYLVSKVEGLAAQGGNAASHGHFFAVVESLGVLKLQARQDYSVCSIEWLFEHLSEVLATSCLGPDDVGGVVDMVQHVHVTVGDAETVDAAKVGGGHRSFPVEVSGRLGLSR